MRTLLLLCIPMFFSTIIQAQKELKQKDILGKWELKASDMEDFYYDVERDSISLSKTYRDEIGSEKERSKIKELKFDFSYLKGSTLDFGPGNKFRQYIFEEESIGTFKLISKGKKQFIQIVMNDMEKTTNEIEVWMEKGFLYLNFGDDGGKLVNIYRKK